MSMYDSVTVKCPYCGRYTELQSKGGPCTMGDYDSLCVPIDVAGGLDNEGYCDYCHESFKIVLTTGTVGVLALKNGV